MARNVPDDQTIESTNGHVDAPKGDFRRVDIPKDLLRHVSAGQAWRARSEPELISLPNSGHTVIAQRQSLLALAAKLGHIPNELSRDVMRLLAMGQPDDTSNEARQIELFVKNSRAFFDLFQLVILSPRLVMDRDPDYAANEIGPQDIYDADLIWLYFTYLEGSNDRVTPFRVARPTDRT